MTTIARLLPHVRHLALALTLGALAACSPVRLVEAVALLTDIAAEAPATDIARQPFAFESNGQPRPADLYVAREQTEAALVLVPGAAEEGYRDPRLVRFATVLADAGFLIMVPELGEDDPLRVSATDAEVIADAVLHLSEVADVSAVGLAAFSYAVGPAMLAALDPATAGKVQFIVAVGGYYDVTAALTYLTTGAFRQTADAPWQYGSVRQDAKWRFVRANAHRIDSPDDRLLTRIAELKIQEPDADVSEAVAHLHSDERAVYDLLTNEDPDRVPHMMADLPARFRELLHAIDPARRDFDRLEAELILVHGRDDPLVPYTESVKLARAARRSPSPSAR